MKKRILSVLLVMAMAMSMTACGADTTPDIDGGITEETTVAPAETPAETTTVPETTTTETTTVPETTTAETTTTPETTTVVTATAPAETTTVVTTTAPVVTTTVATTTVPVTTTAKTYPLPQPIYEIAPSMKGSVLDLAGKDMPVVDYSYLEDDVLAMVNAERAKCGVSPLTVEATLQHAAEVRVKEAFVTQIGGHTRPDGSRCETAFPKYVAGAYSIYDCSEGMHVCYPGFRTTGEKYLEVWDSFRDSAGHYATMTKAKWNHIGIGLYGTEGQFWLVLTYSV